MTSQETISEVMNRLAQGWGKHDHRIVGQFALILGQKLNTPETSRQDGKSASKFWLYLDDIRLRGMQRIPCCLLGGDNEAITTENLRIFWQNHRFSDSIPLIFTLSQSALMHAQNMFQSERCAILSSAQVREILTARYPKKILTRYIVQQTPLQWLNPYDYQHPVSGPMFYGREKELAQLRQHDRTNFAIAGPGRIGKSSLVKQYRYQIVHDQSFNVRRIFEIDFSSCMDKSENGVARFFAMKIESKQMSDRMNVDGIINFLRYQKVAVVREPLDLLLDEVDEVCNSEVFRQLGIAAREGLCRLILCGRGQLLEMMTSNESSLASRIELIKLPPLAFDEARNLLTQPLNDVGIEFEQPVNLISHILKFTGRMPNLLQFYGKQLVELADHADTKVIKMEHLQEMEENPEFGHFFISPLEGIAKSEHLNLALHLLQAKPTKIDMTLLKETMRRTGLAFDPQAVINARNELVINNVLVNHKGHLQIANDSLCQCAAKLGYYELIS